MAGFFGLFDYNKVGPGVDKNGPQKRGFVVFFEIYFRKFWKLAEASLLSSIPAIGAATLLWLYDKAFGSTPVWVYLIVLALLALTVGLTNSGLTFIGRNYAREKHAFVWADFKETVKKNWRQALPVGFVNTLLLGIILYALYFYFPVAAEDGTAPSLLQYIPFCLMVLVYVVFTWMKYYMYMLMITFKFNVRQLYRNSFIFAMSGLKQNMIISLSLLLVYALLVMVAFIHDIALVLSLALAVAVVPGFRNLLIQYNIFPLVKKHIIDPYYAEHPNEDVQQRQDLALDPTAEEKKAAGQEEEEAIFKDMGRTVQEEAPKEEKSGRKIPKQYTEEQMRRGRRITRDNVANDDDDTI